MMTREEARIRAIFLALVAIGSIDLAEDEDRTEDWPLIAAELKQIADDLRTRINCGDKIALRKMRGRLPAGA